LPLSLEAGKASKPDENAVAQRSGKKKKKAGGKDKPLAGAPTAVAIVAGGGWGPLLAVLKPNRIIRKRTDANCSSFHSKVFLGLSNP
jgi:hypothetical protein